MPEDPTALERLNACDEIYLIRCDQDVDEYRLRLLVHEARAEKEAVGVDTGNADVDAIFANAYPITTKAGYDAFTITFDYFHAFLVRDEILCNPEENDDRSGHLRRYSSSWVLDFVGKSMRIHPEDSYQHLAVVCSNQVVDVITPVEPTIEHRLVREDEV